MKILFVSSEVAPFAKTGGLADVSGALPVALAKHGAEVRVVTPAYSLTHYGDAPLKLALPGIEVKTGRHHHQANVLESKLPGSDVPIYFVENPELFHRDGFYQSAEGDFGDNALRFAFFCKAVAWMIKGLGWRPDVVHCNDWQTALLPVFLKADWDVASQRDLRTIRSVYTIHNMAYQGMISQEEALDVGLDYSLLHPAALEFYGAANLMKGGLVFSDALTTVSATYAQEIQTEEFGNGLDGVLRERSRVLHGILNGIDYEQWNPETDEHLPATYSVDDMSGKAACKAALQKELRLDVNPEIPLLVMITRLDPQKGLDIMLPLIPAMMMQSLQLAVLGTGLPEYHSALSAAMEKYPGRVAVSLKFDNGLAHRMEAGGDIFLMPSRFEPCGLNQMYSLRYGTLPIVRRTGGLADSVEAIDTNGNTGTGFVFDDYSSVALLSSIQQAATLFADGEAWSAAQRRAMTQDFSWTRSASRYMELYRSLV